MMSRCVGLDVKEGDISVIECALQMHAAADLRSNHVGVSLLPSTRHPSSVAELYQTQPVIQRLFRQSVGPAQPLW